MIKKIIFDLDNTLIIWKEEFLNTLNETLEQLNINYDDSILTNLKKAINIYESKYNIYKEEYLLELFKKQTKIDLPNNFVEMWKNNLKKCVSPDYNKETIDTLEYLYQKYDLIVLTNWFTDQQSSRLENANILKYFKEVIGTDKVLNKPNKEAFIYACKNNLPSECVMVGDNLNLDIIGAQNAGLKTILIDYKNKYPDYKDKITNIIELKEML